MSIEKLRAADLDQQKVEYRGLVGQFLVSENYFTGEFSRFDLRFDLEGRHIYERQLIDIHLRPFVAEHIELHPNQCVAKFKICL